MRIGNLTHTWVGDLKLELTSPTGTIVVLADRPGGTANSGDNFTGTVFDDEASVAIGTASTAAPYTGSFRPQADQLSRFDGESQQGTWTLKVSDLGPRGHRQPQRVGSRHRDRGLRFRAAAAAGAADRACGHGRLRLGHARLGRHAGRHEVRDPSAWPRRHLPRRPDRHDHVEHLHRHRPYAGAGVLLQGRRAERREPRPAVGGALRHASAPAVARPPSRPSRRTPARGPHAGSVGTASVDPRSPEPQLRAQVPRHGGSHRFAQAHDGQAGDRRAQAAQAGSREEVLHRPGQWPGTDSGQAGPQGHACVETNTAAARDREGHARDAHGNAKGHPARSASPAAALSRVPSA